MSAANTIDIQNIPQASHLKIILEFASMSANSATVLILNNDTGANYFLSAFSNDGTTITPIASTSATMLSLTNKGANENSGGAYQIEITNSTVVSKKFNYQGYIRDASPIMFSGSGNYNNTSVPINRVTARLSAGATFPAGSRLIIYGSSQ